MISTTPDFIDAATVASMIGVARSTFLRNRLVMELREGFPRPMPHTRSPLLWRRSQVAAWIEAQGRFAPGLDPVEAGPNVVLLREARRA